VVGVGEERAPVSCGAILWLEAEAREVVAARCRSGEGKSRCSGEKLGRRRRGSLFKRGRRGGSGGGGGERGGARVRWGMAQQLVAAPAGGCGRRRCRETVEGDGVGVTRDDTTDMWAGTRRGPVKHSSI
jgi:hypothetical protein